MLTLPVQSLHSLHASYSTGHLVVHALHSLFVGGVIARNMDLDYIANTQAFYRTQECMPPALLTKRRHCHFTFNRAFLPSIRTTSVLAVLASRDTAHINPCYLCPTYSQSFSPTFHLPAAPKPSSLPSSPFYWSPHIKHSQHSFKHQYSVSSFHHGVLR